METIITCPRCEVELVAVLPEKENLEGGVEGIKENEELQVLRKEDFDTCRAMYDILEEANIPCVIARNESADTNMVIMDLLVPVDRAEEAMAALNREWAESLEIEGLETYGEEDAQDEVQEGDALTCPACGHQFIFQKQMECPDCGLFLGLDTPQ